MQSTSSPHHESFSSLSLTQINQHRCRVTTSGNSESFGLECGPYVNISLKYYQVVLMYRLGRTANRWVIWMKYIRIFLRIKTVKWEAASSWVETSDSSSLGNRESLKNVWSCCGFMFFQKSMTSHFNLRKLVDYCILLRRDGPNNSLAQFNNS